MPELAGEPDLLLLDEPFSGLDAPSRNEFFALLNQLARQGVQMILVTHHKADIFPAITTCSSSKTGVSPRFGSKGRGAFGGENSFQKGSPA